MQYKQGDFPSPLTFDNKVTIFRERLWGWYLHPAELCANGGNSHDGNAALKAIPHSGFAVLAITLNYFETVGKHLEGYVGSYESAKHFKIGVRDVLPTLASHTPASDVDSLLDTLYSAVRCGLYHTSQTASGVVLAGGPAEAFGFDPGSKTLVINPHRLPKLLIDHRDSYCAKLRAKSDQKLRDKFEARFDYELK